MSNLILQGQEKVREQIEEHVFSTGIDQKIPPVDLLSGNYEEFLIVINHQNLKHLKLRTQLSTTLKSILRMILSTTKNSQSDWKR